MILLPIKNRIITYILQYLPVDCYKECGYCPKDNGCRRNMTERGERWAFSRGRRINWSVSVSGLDPSPWAHTTHSIHRLPVWATWTCSTTHAKDHAPTDPSLRNYIQVQRPRLSLRWLSEGSVQAVACY